MRLRSPGAQGTARRKQKAGKLNPDFSSIHSTSASWYLGHRKFATELLPKCFFYKLAKTFCRMRATSLYDCAIDIQSDRLTNPFACSTPSGLLATLKSSGNSSLWSTLRALSKCSALQQVALFTVIYIGDFFWQRTPSRLPKPPETSPLPVVPRKRLKVSYELGLRLFCRCGDFSIPFSCGKMPLLKLRKPHFSN